jgi:hypothetical protein
MKPHFGLACLFGLLAIVTMLGCSSDSGNICKDTQHESEPEVVISGMTMQPVVDSPPANKDCTTKMVVEYRFNDEEEARHSRPENVTLLFIVSDGGEPDTLSLPDPTSKEEDDMKFWSVRVAHTARDRASNPVYYSILAGSETVELPEIWLSADIEYVPHGTTIGMP